MEKRMIRSKKLRIYVLFAISVDENGSISEMAIKKRTLTMRRKYWRNIGLARDDEEEEEERDLEVVGNIFVFAFRCSFYCCLLLFVFFVSFDLMMISLRFPIWLFFRFRDWFASSAPKCFFFRCAMRLIQNRSTIHMY